ncbi:MAG: hypothetical protein JHC71_12700 [Blastococcus sp.]|nr:hypothetical protein [Blastococcus sp.]
MRTLPIDANAFRILATGEVTPVAVWAELTDGSRRPVPGAQEKDEHGTPLWNVGAIAPPAQEGDRAELISVRIASHERPQVAEFAPVRFDQLVCRVGVNRRTGQLSQYWSAARVASATVKAA